MNLTYVRQPQLLQESVEYEHLSQELQDLISQIGPGGVVITEYDCEASVQPGDLLFFSSSGNAQTVFSNYDERPVLAICIDKLSDTTCRMLLYGRYDLGTSSLLHNQYVYLGVDGKLSSIQPTGGFIQILGYCLIDDGGNKVLVFYPFGKNRLRSVFDFCLTTISETPDVFSPELIKPNGAVVEWDLNGTTVSGNNISYEFSYTGEKDIVITFPDYDFYNVLEIDFNDCELLDEFPFGIFRLENLEVALFANCHYTGPIPSEIGRLSALTTLNIQNNQLSGSIPPEIGKLVLLENLFLSDNQLSGSIPPEIGSLTNLQQLLLYNNQLTGSIPTEVGDLTNLLYLHLYNNQLSGSIPPAFGNCVELEYLRLQKNQLSGSIPPEIGTCIALEELYLQDNQLSGSIPPEVGDLTNLLYLGLNDNQLSGSIPPEIGSLTNLQQLLLYNNQLTGSIPTEIGDCTALKWLFLYDNQLSGLIPPEVVDCIELEYLILYNNQLSGVIASEIAALPKIKILMLMENNFSQIDLSNFVNDLWTNRVTLGGNFCYITLNDNNGLTVTAIDQIEGTGAYLGDGLAQAGCTVVY